MNTRPVTIFVLLTTSFLIGNFSGVFIVQKIQTDELAHSVSEGGEPASVSDVRLGEITVRTTECSKNVGHERERASASTTSAVSDEQDPSNDSERQDLFATSWAEAHPDAPPADAPHVVDEYFFGPDPDDPEVVRLREEALEDHIRSLEEAGLPEEDVQAMLDSYKHDTEATDLNEPAHDEPDLSPEKQVEDLVVSLTEAGESAEVIEHMADDFWAGVDAAEVELETDELDGTSGVEGHAEPEPAVVVK